MNLKFINAVEKEREKYETGSIRMVCYQDGIYIYPWDKEKLKNIYSYTIFNDGIDRSHFYKNRKEYLFSYAHDSIPKVGNINFEPEKLLLKVRR